MPATSLSARRPLRMRRSTLYEIARNLLFINLIFWQFILTHIKTMDKQKISTEINVAMPFFFFYLAVVTFYLTISHIFNFFSELLIVTYTISFINVLLLVLAGKDLRNKKRRGIILFCIYIILSLTITIRPIFVDSFKYLQDIINIAFAIFLLTNWKNWTLSAVNENKLPK